jgi:hypothetical protein
MMNTVLPVAFLTSLCNDKFLHEITDQSSTPKSCLLCPPGFSVVDSVSCVLLPWFREVVVTRETGS